MHAFLIGLVIGIFGGGYGGYRWGASVERRAQQVAQAFGSKPPASGTGYHTS